MIINRYTLLSWLVLLSLVPLALQAAHAATTNNVNVRDYGAKGDGVTDDTEALRTAMKAATPTVSKPSKVQTYYQAGPALVFPPGEYRISDELALEALEVRGEGRAILCQTNQEKNILIHQRAWRLEINNLTFVGGKNQIDLYNPNLDSGQIIINHCRFYAAAGFAINSSVVSTTMKIENCEFIQCYQAWCNKRCDQAVMRDCWITTSKEMTGKAAIEHRGMRLTIENLVAVPLVGGPDQRWIDNYGYDLLRHHPAANLTLRHCRFGGEGGGFTPVYNYSRYIARVSQNAMGNTILFDDCLICALGSAEKSCAVYCFEVPNSIRIENCVTTGGKYVMIDKKLDLSTYFKNVERSFLSYSVSNCTGPSGGELPEGLLKPMIIQGPEEGVFDEAQTLSALKQAEAEVKAHTPKTNSGTMFRGHKQQTQPSTYVELLDTPEFWGETTRCANPKQGFGLGLSKVGHGALLLFKQAPPEGSLTLLVKAEVDLDRHPWLTWRQIEGKAPASFALRVMDKQSGKLYTLYNETFEQVYEYHAHNLKQLFDTGGKREIEIRWYSLGWAMPTPVEDDWFWAKPGQYTVLEFLRMESG